MSKKRTYESRICDMMQKAKAEIMNLMQKKGVREVSLNPGSVIIFSEDENGAYQAYSVSKIALANYGMGDVLELDYPGPSFWYSNAIAWGQICDCVRRMLK